MAITKYLLNNMLVRIFSAGNMIELFTEMPDEESETAGTKLSGAGYIPYEIREDDFAVNEDEVTSAVNIMLYLCDTEDKNYSVQVKGFGVYDNTSKKNLLYYGEFEEEMTIKYNSVPTIKQYNVSKNEGIKITLTSSSITG